DLGVHVGSGPHRPDRPPKPLCDSRRSCPAARAGPGGGPGRDVVRCAADHPGHRRRRGGGHRDPRHARFPARGRGRFPGVFGGEVAQGRAPEVGLPSEDGRGGATKLLTRQTVGVLLLNPHAILDTTVVIGATAAALGAGARVPFAVGAVGASLLWFLLIDRKSTRLNSSHVSISYAVFC